ncbi:MAG: alpha/beta hydrolase [Burkholderiaceae bacterium]|nr:alpha/beta hydrolase [Burkholderiaceae bacterium]
MHSVDALGKSCKTQALAELAYGPDPVQRLDVYVPQQRAVDWRPLPVLVFFHGGAWIRGDRSWLKFMAPAVTSMPAIFVAGTYRHAPAARWPAQYCDVRDAIRQVHERISEFGGDPARIVVGGHSAGGHLATLAILRGEIPPMRACFPVSSSFDLRYGDVSPDSEEGRVYRFLLAERSQDADASPILFAQGNRVPFHLSWGSADLARIIRTSEAMTTALRDDGCAVTTAIVSGAGHFETHLQLADPENPWYACLRSAFDGDL